MATERVVAVVEARMGSSRLPGKSMRPLAGAPLVQRVVERLRRASTIDDIVLATTVEARDDVLADHFHRCGVNVFRGSEDDVLLRILGAAQSREATVHVQCWGDCPFLEPTEVDRTVTALLESDDDLVGNGLAKERTLPYGLDVIALRVSALLRAEELTRESRYHREHGTTFIYQTPNLFRARGLETPADLRYPAFNATINTEDDYTFVASIYEALLPRNPSFGIRDVMAFIRSRPDLLAHPNASALASP